MPLVKEKKKELIAQYGKHKKDTGSTEIQISLLTERINDLTKHLNTTSPKDYQSRRGLIMLVGKRKRLLNYLERIDIEALRRIVDKLGIRN